MKLALAWFSTINNSVKAVFPNLFSPRPTFQWQNLLCSTKFTQVDRFRFGTSGRVEYVSWILQFSMTECLEHYVECDKLPVLMTAAWLDTKVSYSQKMLLSPLDFLAWLNHMTPSCIKTIHLTITRSRNTPGQEYKMQPVMGSWYGSTKILRNVESPLNHYCSQVHFDPEW